MKAIIVTPFDNYSYQVRIKYIEKYLLFKGYTVKILSSDFDHRNKTVYSAYRKNLELLHVPEYKKNLSIERIKSHKVFSKKVLVRLNELSPDLIYCSAPPNFLFKYVSIYKKKHPKVKLIYELGDLWPETLPLSYTVKKLAAPVLNIWAGIRNKNIKYADEIVYECQMFRDVVSNKHPDVHSQVVYLCKEDYYKDNFVLNNNDYSVLRFAYVGSLNNIVDIELIIAILSQISDIRKVELEIIGDGECSKRFIKLCDDSNIKYNNHGIVYDEEKKHNILSKCHFGFNIMKSTVAVGATMKSLEYFHEGLILINNIQHDTERIVTEYNCGFNVSFEKIDELKTYLDKSDDIDLTEMRYNSRKVFDLFFCEKIIKQKFDDIL